jgi:hypothetical protein
MGKQSRGTLEEKEVHPEAHNALRFVLGLGLQRLAMYQEAFSSCAIEGNRLGEICSETLHRMTVGEPVSDRYILGLAWAIKRMEETAHKNLGKIFGKCKSPVSKVKRRRN